MQSDSEVVEFVNDADRKAYQRRIMQIALSHRVNSGVDALHMHRFQAAGLLEDVAAPAIPDSVKEILKGKQQAGETHRAQGPFVFVRDDKAMHVLEPETLLLHAIHETRCAALDYLKTGASLPSPWLTGRTREMLDEHSSDVRSHDVAKWRSAGIKLLTAIRHDLYRQLAGLRQSLSFKYQEGIDENVSAIMNPRLEVLAHLQPPLRRPHDQRDQVRAWIVEFSELPTIFDALDAYLNRCGFIPFCRELSAAELARLWMNAHESAELQWSDLWSWAEQAETPFARYHALTIGLHVENVVPQEATTDFWEEYCKALGVNETNNSENSNEEIWRLFCELASHFTHHIEAVHPGPDGESVACSAWWLADLIGRVLLNSNAEPSATLQNLVAPQSSLSYMRWMVGRSSAAPSAFRYVTLHIRSVWAMSLVAQFAVSIPTVLVDSIPGDTKAKIRESLIAYLLTTHLAVRRDSSRPVFAYEENVQILELCGALFPEDEEIEAILEFIKLRAELGAAEEFEKRLDRFGAMSPQEQQLLALSLKETVFVSQRADAAILDWLAQTEQAADFLLNLSAERLSWVLEALLEFQQRQSAEWTVRIPHTVANAIEKADNEEQAKSFYLFVILMSHNAGIVSPIQRVASSRWRASFLAELAEWRETMVSVKYSCEPWVAARIRATSAAISRLIGPRKYAEQAAEEGE